MHMVKAARCLAKLLTISVIANGYVSAASAQCPPNAKIFIDPRLAPQRMQVSRNQFVAVMANPYSDEEAKKRITEAYFSQYQPIQMQFGNGVVLISPTNPCIQQYIGP
jgi:hypothetical protein